LFSPRQKVEVDTMTVEPVKRHFANRHNLAVQDAIVP
jgi:hypothetical protein